MLQPTGQRRRRLSSGAPGSARRWAASRPDARDTIAQRLARTEAGELDRYYKRLLAEYGPQGWWPAKGRLEVILGAILTQNTNWRNAASAIRQLREAGLLNLRSLRGVNESELRSLIRSAGFFRQKARTIVTFVRWLEEHHEGSLRRMFKRPAEELRTALLKLRGLGPETADAILLYAGNRPVFVADAYTRRILARHGMLAENAGYTETQEFIHWQLERDPRVYNEFHALLVEAGKRHCKRRSPCCGGCPLEEFLPSTLQAPAGPAA
jgi:endonuclease III related protein